MIHTVRRLADGWSVIVPIVAVAVLGAAWGRRPPMVAAIVVAIMLAAAVLAAVHHAEVVAHRVGEPFGSLVLAIAVTVIEVGLIVSMMASGGGKADTLARDTVISAVMITTTGIVGVSLFLGTRHGRVVAFNAEGTGGALAAVATLATLCLVLPTFTTSRPGPAFSPAQLGFAAVSSLLLYGVFVLTQTVRHRDYFLPVAPESENLDEADGGGTEDGGGSETPSAGATVLSLGLLVVALVAVVGLAKVESPVIESGVHDAGLPSSVVGVVIALLVLLPETLAAARAARDGRLQTSLNLALGSAMASIGLTIPAIAVASVWLSGPLVLGLDATHTVLLAITVAVSILTVVPGRATLLQSGVHLVLFAAFLFLAVSP